MYLFKEPQAAAELQGKPNAEDQDQEDVATEGQKDLREPLDHGKQRVDEYCDKSPAAS